MHKFSLSVRVYYEDTDAAGVVYHTSYLRFMERSRTEWLRSFGFDLDDLHRLRGLIFAVRSVQVEYLSPARYNNLLTITASLLREQRSCLWVEHRVLHEDTRLLCRGKVQIVTVDAERMHARSVPKDIMQRLANDR